MADVDSNLYSWSTTAASNKPLGTTSVGSGLDDNLREIQKVVRTDLSYYNSAAVASAGTVDLGAQTGNFLDISGTTTITAFGTVAAGVWKVIRFQGALTLTHNGTSLILPGAANITTAANDRALMYSLGSGNWVCAHYEPASGVGWKTAAALGAGINALTEDTAPIAANDFVVTYDASASTAKKVNLDVIPRFTVGTFTRDLTTADGNQSVTGVGFTPRALICFANVTGTAALSIGYTDGTNYLVARDNNASSSGTYAIGTGGFISFQTSNGNLNTATLASFDSDGFTVTWAKTGSPTGTGTIGFLAIG